MSLQVLTHVTTHLSPAPDLSMWFLLVATSLWSTYKPVGGVTLCGPDNPCNPYKFKCINGGCCVLGEKEYYDKGSKKCVAQKNLSATCAKNYECRDSGHECTNGGCCPDTKYYKPGTGTCVEKISAGSTCTTPNDYECAEGNYCDGRGCCGDRQYYNSSTNSCEGVKQCTTDADCPGVIQCRNGRCCSGDRYWHKLDESGLIAVCDKQKEHEQSCTETYECFKGQCIGNACVKDTDTPDSPNTTGTTDNTTTIAVAVVGVVLVILAGSGGYYY